MADYRNNRKQSHDINRGKNRKSHSNSSSPGRQRQKFHSKRDSYTRENSHEKETQKANFPLLIYIESGYLSIFSEQENFSLNDLKKKFKLDKICFDDSQAIPDFDGKTLRIQDENLERKQNCIEEIVKRIGKFHNDNGQKENQPFTILILIPDGMVSLLIGKSGKQINTIKKTSNCDVIVNQPIVSMTCRSVKIEGKYYNINKALKQIYQLIEEKAPYVKQIEKVPDVNDLKAVSTWAQFIFPSKIIGHVYGKKGGYVQQICEKYEVKIKFDDETRHKLVQRDETLAIIKGKLIQVQGALQCLLRRVEEFYQNNQQQYDQQPLRMIIPKMLVPKIIGKSGCMIKEIENKSGGAKINIESTKYSEKYTKECLVQIRGQFSNKYDAACFLLDQIETHKNGGPTLISGKALFQNLAGQFKYSVQGRDFMNEEGQLENSDRKQNFSRSRSRSTSENKKQARKKDKKSPSQDSDISQHNQQKSRQKQDDHEERDRPRGDSEYYQSMDENNNLSQNDQKKSRSRSRSVGEHQDRQNRFKLKDKKVGSRSSSRQKSLSIEVSKSRSRSKSEIPIDKRKKNKSLSRSPSSSVNSEKQIKKNKNRELKRKSVSRQRSKSKSRSKKISGKDRNNSKNQSYISKTNKLKIVSQIVVPDYLVSHLIGQGGQNNKKLMKRSRANIAYISNSDYRVQTSEGVKGCIVRIEGSIEETSEAYKLIMRDIADLERKLNGEKFQ